MDTPPTEGTDVDPMRPRAILEQVKRHLEALDTSEGDHATEEDFIIIQCLLLTIRAAQRKGYSEELLIYVLRSLVHGSSRT